jgi:molybdate transport system regulatory protein
MNKCFKGPLVETSKGGKAHGGATLTPLGEEVLARYRAIEGKVYAAVTDELAAFNDMINETPPRD